MLESFVIEPSSFADGFDLGGPCLEGAGPTSADFYSVLRQASAAVDREQLIELHKQNLRAMCSNQNRWFALAETYRAADRPQEAIEVLHELHRRGAEIKPETLRDHPELA